jgi:hypothetical protein
VAGEVRIFPLLVLGGERSPFVAPIVSALRADGFAADVRIVPYEFRRGANEMLSITRS